jgi:hypothetical protein
MAASCNPITILGMSVWIFFIVVGAYTTTVSLISGIVLGIRVRSPFFAALAGGPTAVVALYGSVVAIALILRGPHDLASVDWWLFVALMTYPATPGFVVGDVAACVTSLFRTIRASKHR